MATFPFSVVGLCHNHLATLYSGSPWSKIPDLPLEFRRYSVVVPFCCSSGGDICHTVGDISTSGLDGHIAISSCPAMSHLFVDTFFEFGVVEDFVYHARITVILIVQIYSAVTLTMYCR